MAQPPKSLVAGYLTLGMVVLFAAAGVFLIWWEWDAWFVPQQPPPASCRSSNFQPRKPLDTSGFGLIMHNLKPWGPNASLEEVADAWRGRGYRGMEEVDHILATTDPCDESKVQLLLAKVILANYEGEPRLALKDLDDMRSFVENDPGLAEEWLYTVIYYQGVTALRLGETENCVKCRGVSACILPISPAARHQNPEGSRLAIRYFDEYLGRFSDDLEVRWLLNLAHMTLGEYPDKVEDCYLVPLDHYRNDEFDIGRFRDVSYEVGVGVDRLNWSGGAIMDDFDNDGLLDLVATSTDPTQAMVFYRNKGDGTFEDRTEKAGLGGQLGGEYCVQTDYDNDGRLDITWVSRGSRWYPYPIRPSLLHNNGDGTFTDVTEKAGLMKAVNSPSAAWADYDNDGRLDLYVCCQFQPNLLYHNKGDGTFEEVAARAGVQGSGHECMGAAWIDYDNDGYPDLFLSYLDAPAQLFHNNRDGTFTDVTKEMGIDGPNKGYSCWAFDYDNDGWPDIFCTSYDRSVADVVKGLLGQPTDRQPSRLYHNLGGKGFRDVAKEVGLDGVYSPMGSNFGDFDNDGYLDIYLGTGEPNFSTLVPNRMFKNVAGKHFAEVTSSSGTGHLQKGHGVACGDWRRTGDIDIFEETGGQVNGDRYHNVLFMNPGGHGNHWLTVKLVGKKTNRPAIGARIKATTAGDPPLTVYRHVSSGSSFGANPLQQTIGLGKADRVADLEIHWPTSGTTQVFHDLAVDQAVEVTEFDDHYRKLDWTPVPSPD